MIFSMGLSNESFEKLQAALAAESVAITALHDALKSGLKDNKVLMALSDRMTEAHNKKMDIWDQLQQQSLDG